MKDYSD